MYKTTTYFFSTFSIHLSYSLFHQSIETPGLRFPGTICVRFGYHMSAVNADEMGSLRVATSQNDVTVLEVSGDQGDQWLQVGRTINIGFGERVSTNISFYTFPYRCLQMVIPGNRIVILPLDCLHGNSRCRHSKRHFSGPTPDRSWIVSK